MPNAIRQAAPTTPRTPRAAGLFAYWRTPGALSLVALLGTIVIPMLLALATNSWTAPTAEDYVRMAFSSVAGYVIAAITVVVVAVIAAVRYGRRSALWQVVAVFAVLWCFSGIGSAAHLLLQRLG